MVALSISYVVFGEIILGDSLRFATFGEPRGGERERGGAATPLHTLHSSQTAAQFVCGGGRV